MPSGSGTKTTFKRRPTSVSAMNQRVGGVVRCSSRVSNQITPHAIGKTLDDLVLADAVLLRKFVPHPSGNDHIQWMASIRKICVYAKIAGTPHRCSGFFKPGLPEATYLNDLRMSLFSYNLDRKFRLQKALSYSLGY
jgi:hypothetical protein